MTSKIYSFPVLINVFTERPVSFNSSAQICIVHQIKNSCKNVVFNNKKELTAEIKNIYNAPNKEMGTDKFGRFEEKWGGKYPYAILSRRKDWMT